jgi:hypothetical protein
MDGVHARAGCEKTAPPGEKGIDTCICKKTSPFGTRLFIKSGDDLGSPAKVGGADIKILSSHS